MIVRRGGFPCRLLGCERAFQVLDQRSMDSLKAASAERSDHEVRAHGYHHVRLDEGKTAYMPYQRGKPRPAASK